MDQDSPGPGRWLAVYSLGWLAYSTLFVVGLLTNGVPADLAVRNAVSNLIPEASLGVLLLRVPERLPWPDQNRGSFFAAHSALLALYLCATNLGWFALWGLDRLVFGGEWNLQIALRVLPWRGATSLLVYGALIGFGYAWRNAAARRASARRAARAEALQSKAELEALRSQLNPHFVLNTLHALVGLVRRQPALAENALERLGDLLRRSLRIQRAGIDVIPLADEWELVRGFVDLERLRLGERLDLQVDLARDTLSETVPSFALQTLVENAIRHGVAPRSGVGRLTIASRRIDGNLRIEVGNDAPEITDPPEPPGSGVGLRLLQDRLAALYGGDARLSTRRDASAFAATLDLPLLQPEDE